MVGISFKKKIMNIVHLETYTSYKEYKETRKIKVPLNSFICYAIHKFCTSNFVVIRFVPVEVKPEQEKAAFTLVEEDDEEFTYLINDYEIPWTVALCTYPVIMAEDVIITGLCAVTRQICKLRNCYVLRQEHDDGLLGFRHTCLQAPNKTSVWTKFCEIEIIRTVNQMLIMKDIKKIPKALVRFEDHMKQPVRIHNVYKVAQNMNKEKKSKTSPKADQQADNIELPANAEQQLSTEPLVEVEQQATVKPQPDVEQQATAGPQTNVEQLVTDKQQTNIEEQATAKQQPIAKVLVTAEKQANYDQQASAVPQTNIEHQENIEQAEQKVKFYHPTNDKQQATAEAQNSKDSEESTPERTPKSRKWKSHKKKENVLDCSTKIEDLPVIHEFAEGPFLTLADLVLLPPYHVLVQTMGKALFESLLPYTYKWYKNLISIPRIQETFMSLMSKFDLKQLSFENMTMRSSDNVSLYNCDPHRHNPRKRIYTKDHEVEISLSSITKGLELTLCENDFEPTITWSEIPEQANPFAGYLPDTRAQRKSEQLQNLAQAVLSMATDGDVIVDFCCGTGHLGILLAYLLPRCTIILLENKVQSLARARERVVKMKLTNVFYYQCNLDFFIGEFDIGIGLHACGTATDLILDKCLKQNAKFILSPCCYGAIHSSCRMEYPRSKMFAKVPLNQYLCLAHAADQTHHEHPLAVRGARCMRVIDSDRAHLAEEFGYKVTIRSLKPITCTPKNNLIIGIPTEK